MSKSYGNQIPMFVPEKELRKYIMKIVTDSSTPEEPKPLDSLVFQLYKLFATKEEVATMKKRYQKGIGWGEAKEELFKVANREIAPLREKYDYYMANYAEVENALKDGAQRARAVARQTINRVRKAIGASV